MKDLIVETAFGKVEGVVEDGVRVWKGIPFARPPVGRLRFRPPEPPESWSGIRDASAFGPSAMQRRAAPGMTVSEDCLYLNIWAPAADGRKKPVMVWIHGGGFMSGSGASPATWGTSFAREGDVVLVTINYRLGPFGFLHLAEIGGEEYEDSANIGLQDQVAALRWVRDNIEAFGGDPNQVTIFGESAGGRSVGLLLAMPSARGLFHRAIIQSGSITAFETADKASGYAAEMLRHLHVDKNSLAALQTIPAERFLEAAEELRLGVLLAPVPDGRVLPGMPLDQLVAGFSTDIPILIGLNLEEYKLNYFIEGIWKTLDERGKLERFRMMTEPYWSEVSAYYLERFRPDLPLDDRMIAMMTFHQFTFAALQMADIRARQGQPVWMYRFDWRSPLMGAAHGVDVPFVFNRVEHAPWNRPGTDLTNARRLALAMHRAWIAFARNGHPNAEPLPEWPAYRPGEEKVMVFDDVCSVEHDPYREERGVWEEALGRLGIEHRPRLIIEGQREDL
jgi:para-nitrobenzyl esterase